MTEPVNPSTATWVNAAFAVDQNGNQVAWSPAADMAGVQIGFDGAPAISVPNSAGITSLNLKTISAYQSLAPGSHTMTIADVTKEGIVGSAATSNPFSIAVVPVAPSNLALA